MKKFAAFDIDGTLFRWQLFHELVFELRKQGLLDQDANKLDVAFASWQALESSWHDYESTIITAIMTDIKNISTAQLESAAQIVNQRSGHRVHAYTSSLAKKLKAEGYVLIAISGSQQEIAELFAKRYGFDHCIGMVFERDAKGSFTGDFERFVVGRKAEIIKNLITEHDLTLEDSYAIGDSSGDISMLELVQNPIAFNPDESLLAKAQEQDWPIIIERKNLAYTLRKGTDGYTLAETTVFKTYI